MSIDRTAGAHLAGSRPAANALAARTWGAMVMDPTDLWALPMVGLAAAWMLWGVLSSKARHFTIGTAVPSACLRSAPLCCAFMAGVSRIQTSCA